MVERMISSFSFLDLYFSPFVFYERVMIFYFFLLFDGFPFSLPVFTIFSCHVPLVYQCVCLCLIWVTRLTEEAYECKGTKAGKQGKEKKKQKMRVRTLINSCNLDVDASW
jgi:hypothetical protein